MSQKSFWVSVTHVCRNRKWKYSVNSINKINSFRRSIWNSDRILKSFWLNFNFNSKFSVKFVIIWNSNYQFYVESVIR